MHGIIAQALGTFWSNERAAAAVEFAAPALLLAVGLLNAIDVGYYAISEWK
jgi:Flp pilus assembly protein TadG